MAFLGGFCPLPGRLGGDALTGWSAEQHARCCSDAASVGRTVPFAVLTFYHGNPQIIESYNGQNGNGLGNAPTASGWSTTTITWPTQYLDEFGNSQIVNLRAVTATVDSSSQSCYARVTGPNTVEVKAYTAGGSSVQSSVLVTVYGGPLETAKIGSYGGATDKRNCTAEATPYTESWYLTMQAARGSLYSQEREGLVHVENLALARHFAWQNRLTEQFQTNTNSATAGVSIPEKIEELDIQVSLDDTDADVRAALSAKESLVGGGDIATIDLALERLLGSWLIRTWRDFGTLDSPPDWTWGPAWDTGPATYDLGGGTWSSVRSHLVVELRHPTGSEAGEFLAAIARMSQYLDDALPATMSFDWCCGLSDTSTSDPDDVLGFHLDTDSMDYVGLS